MRFYWLLAIGFLLLGCKTVDRLEKVEAKPIDVRQEQNVDAPQIVFLYFEIESKEVGDIEIRLLQSQISEGRLKENTIRRAPKVDGNLIVQLLDGDNHVQVEQVIENPLFRSIEQYSEEGEIILNQLELDKTQFFIRFNHKDTIKTLKIYSIQSGRPIEVYYKPIQL